jgi:hypothetical protein
MLALKDYNSPFGRRLRFFYLVYPYRSFSVRIPIHNSV